MHPNVDVCFDPALFPRGRSLFSKRDAVHSCIAASIEQQTPCIGIVIFPALCDGVVVTSQLRYFCVGIFPTNAPAVMSPFKVGDACKARPISRGILFFVRMSVECC